MTAYNLPHFITANNADITVSGNTNLKGSLIAAGYYDETTGNFIDNGNLDFTTNSLTFSNLNSSSYSTNTSVGGGVSINQNSSTKQTDTELSSLNYNASSGITYSKDKTLATIGSGNLVIRELDGHSQLGSESQTLKQVQGDNSIISDDTTKLNRDTSKLTKELYSGGVNSDVSATVDMRMFTSDGRKDIAEDIYRSGEFIDATLEVITNEGSAGDQGFFTHTGNVYASIEVNKEFANLEDGKYALILNSLDTATPEQKQEALNAYAQTYSNNTGVTIEEAMIIAVNKFIGGANHNQGTTNSIFINDNAQGNALDYINDSTHEITHAQINQGLLSDLGYDKNEAYANLMGEHGAENFEWAYGSSEYTLNNLLNYGDINNHIGNDTSTLIQENNDKFVDVLLNDGENVDFDLLHNKYGINTYDPANNAYINKSHLTFEQTKKALSIIADFTPVVGDIKGFAEAETKGDYFFAVLALIPGAGDSAKTAYKAYKEAKAVKDVEGMAKAVNEAKIIQNAKTGKIGEDLAGIDSNVKKETIPSLTETASFRVPDELLKNEKILREIKNVASQSYTRQLKDFNLWAKQEGYTFVLEVREGAKLTKPLQIEIEAGNIILKTLGK